MHSIIINYKSHQNCLINLSSNTPSHYPIINSLKMFHKQPDTPTFQVPQDLLTYPTYLKTNNRHKFLKEKTIPELRNTTTQEMREQFNLLNYADTPDKYFNQNHQQCNRYIDILPYEHSRVKIPEFPDFHTNANYVKSLLDNKIFAIFSQAPYEEFDSFWEAVYYRNIETVFMLCSLYEEQLRFYQADRYWPQQGKSEIFGRQKLKVTNKKVTQIMHNVFLSEITIEGKEGIKNLRHFQWTEWKDLKKPEHEQLEIFEFLLRECRKQIESSKLPWIHCSAGIGRTGTFGGIVDAIRYLEANKKISLFALVENLRKYRIWAVQTFKQYEFIYHYLSDLKLQ